MATLLQWLFLFILLFSGSEPATNELKIPSTSQCACPSDVLIFNCTVVGSGTTLWGGTAFTCPSTTNEIVLRHSQFASPGTSGDCNNGAIVGQSIRVVDNTCFISQLIITVSSNFHNKTVHCQHDSSTAIISVGTELLNVISATNPYPPPKDVYLSNVGLGNTTFSWTSISHSCSTVNYIITSNCVGCPSSTNATMVTCSGLQLSTDAIMCSFSISSRVCDITGYLSHPVILTLKVPDVPRVNIVPTYNNDSQVLTKLFMEITMETSYVIGSNISGNVTSYTVVYSANTQSLNSSIVPTAAQSCQENVCTYVLDVPNSLCKSSNINTNVTISASNALGRGPFSDMDIIDCTNEFVRVNYDSATSTFLCIFNDDSENSCNVTYGLCQGRLTKTAPGQSSKENPKTILVKLQDLTDGAYCYLARVSSSSGNKTFILNIEGQLIRDNGGKNDHNILATLLSGITVPVFAVLGVIIITLIILMKIRHQSLRDVYSLIDHKIDRVCMQFKLKLVTERDFQVYHVEKDYELREFIEQEIEKEFQRGYVYYELTDEMEDISEDKEIIFQNKVTKRFFTPDLDTKALEESGLKGEGVRRPDVGDKYRIFVQSQGSGARHLAADTYLLYDDEKQRHMDKEDQHVPVYLKYFLKKQVDEDGCTLKDFCDKHCLQLSKCNIFLEHHHIKEYDISPIYDVLLMNAETGELFTAPSILKTIRKNAQLEDNYKKVLVLSKFKGSLELKKNMWVVYEDPRYVNTTFEIIEVDRDNVRMSAFIRNRLGSFQKEGAFYEFTDKEDLLCCKKVVRASKDKLRQERHKKQKLSLRATIELFYCISGAPGRGLESSKLDNHMTEYIHCLSQGSRCLKKGTYVLYDCKYLSGQDNANEEYEIIEMSNMEVIDQEDDRSKNGPRETETSVDFQNKLESVCYKPND